MSYVVDHPRKLVHESPDRLVMEIPPFHTGPVGLLPDCEVHLALVESEGSQVVVVTPYQLNPDMMSLNCTFTDGIGLVRLLDAVFEMNINVVNAFGSRLDDLGCSVVSLLLDWGTSRLKNKTPTSPDRLKKYAAFGSHFPIATDRNFSLFDQIMNHCKDVLLYRNADGSDLPELSFHEIPVPHLLQFGRVKVERSLVKPINKDKNLDIEPVSPQAKRKKQGKAHYVKIQLPQALATRLQLNLNPERSTDQGDEVGRRLRYDLLSDAQLRMLRATFRRTEEQKSSLHLAFEHVDAPGTFAAILHPFEAAGFDFRHQKTVVRQLEGGRNVLEVELQVPERHHDLLSDDQETRYRQVALLMLEFAEPADAKRYEFARLEIRAPLYPTRGDTYSVSVSELIKTNSDKLGSRLTRKRGRQVAIPALSPTHEDPRLRGLANAPKQKGSLMDFVRRYFDLRPLEAVTHSELMNAFAHYGVSADPSYVYVMLNRLAKQEKIRKDGKQYFLVNPSD